MNEFTKMVDVDGTQYVYHVLPGIPAQYPVAHRSYGHSARWFISMGYAGYNSVANNGAGYASRERALAAIRYFQTRSAR